MPFVRPISSGTQSFTTDPSEYPVSEPLPKLSALLQTSGQAQYTDDLPITPGTLFAAFAVSTLGPATLAGLDLSAALQAPGLIAFDLIAGCVGLHSWMIDCACWLLRSVGL